MKIPRIYVLGAERIAALAQFFCLYTHILQKGDEVVDIKDIGHIVHRNFLTGEQHCAEYLKHLVLCPLRADFS